MLRFSNLLSVQRLGEFIRYAIAGGISVALNFALILVLTDWLGLDYRLSIVACFVVVTTIAFAMNNSWTFRQSGTWRRKALFRYVVATLAQLGLCLWLCGIGVERLHISYRLAILSLSILCAPITYLFHRWWSFEIISSVAE